MKKKQYNIRILTNCDKLDYSDIISICNKENIYYTVKNLLLEPKLKNYVENLLGNIF